MGRVATGLEIAVVGMAGRFPGAGSLAEFWHNIVEGRESIVNRTADELRAAGAPDAVLRNPHHVAACGALPDVDLFDADYFGYAPRDAALLDPQQRLFLETAVHALEHAGRAGTGEGRSVGVYAGATLSTYLLRHLITNPTVTGSTSHQELVLSNDKDTLATRVSYHLDLQGPSVTVQTACSTSLVAIHLACQALLARDCDLALAGGVSIQLPQLGYTALPGGVLSPDGHCRPFDARANGIVPGNGVGVVALKRLDDALTDRDTVHAVILGSAVNNDGGTKVGFTAPRIDSQAAVVRRAQRAAGVEVDGIAYLEAHGTGTPLGDPIEVAALTRAFRSTTTRRGFCALGSVKALIGHLDAAAGVAGLIKTVLALQAGRLPPSPYLDQVNPALELAAGPFYLPTTARAWPPQDGPRYAAVSSVGMGGTNAHVVLQEAPVTAPAPASSRRWQVLPLSARTPDRVATLRAALIDQLTAQPSPSLAAVAHTLQVGRRTLPHRMAVLYPERAPSVHPQPPGEESTWEDRHESRDTPVTFLFPGQGAQRAGMARDLYRAEPGFRRRLDEVADLLRGHSVDLLDLLYGPGAPAGERLTQTGNAQPALFAVEYALARLWLSWGVRPRAMIGHSIGEYVAACIAGTFSLPDAVAVVAARGALMDRLPPGSMLAVGRPATEVLTMLEPGLALAADNAPASCVVAGERAAVDRLADRLARQDVATRRLRVSHAFHSPMVEPMLEEFAELVATVPRRTPELPFISCSTGQWITPEQVADPWYWAQQTMRAVRFREGVAVLLRDGRQVMLEVGPGSSLSSLVREQAAAASGKLVLPSLGHSRQDEPDDRAVLAALARLWVAGCEVDWAGHWPEPPGRVPLPGYPFARQRHWIDPPGPVPDRPDHPGPPRSTGGDDAGGTESPGRGPGGPGPSRSGHDAVTERVRQVWAELLGIAAVGPGDDFFEAGGTSLLATQVVARVNAVFDVALPAGCLFDAPTVAALADLVRDRLTAQQDRPTSELLAEIRQMSPEQVRSALGDSRDGGRQ